jgi:predicted DCC family thiol-disulfide oxidoreductase YuxK
MDSLTVLFDEECALCRRCHHRLGAQNTYLPLDFLAAGSPAARERFGSVPWLGADLVVVDNQGNVWAGPAAFLMCLWATAHYRSWSSRLSGKTFAPLAERFFLFVSHNRRAIGKVVGTKDCPDGKCSHRVSAVIDPAACPACPACGAPVYNWARKCWSCGSAW